MVSFKQMGPSWNKVYIMCKKTVLNINLQADAAVFLVVNILRKDQPGRHPLEFRRYFGRIVDGCRYISTE